MRRLVLLTLALALCGAVASLALLSGPVLRSVERRATRCAAARAVPGAGTLARLGLGASGEALAAEKMRFRPLPAESTDALESRRSAGKPAPAPPAAPEEPAPTPPPSAPQVVKSGDIMRVGSDIHVAKDEVVRGSVSAIGGDVTVDGHVEGDVSAIRGDVYLGSTARVDGDVVSAGGQIHEEPGAFVGGQRVTAMAGRTHGLRREAEREREEGAGHVVSALLWFLILLGVGWAASQLAPVRTAAAVETLRGAPLLSFGLGALVLALAAPSMIALALLVAFLCITIIGIPLALAAMLGYALFFVVFGLWGFVVGAGGIGMSMARSRDPAAPQPTGLAAARRAVLVGTAVLAGSLLLGTLLGLPRMLGPLRGLGVALFVIAVIAMSVATVMGGGAWLRSEFQTGILGRWWQRRRMAGAASVPPAPAPPAPAPPPAPLPPSAFEPPAPSPPSAFAPPPAPPAPPPALPGTDPGGPPPAIG